MQFLAILSLAALAAAGPILSRRQESAGMVCRVAGGEGLCQTSATGCAGGSFQPADSSSEWPCWGSSDIQCCVPSSDTAPSDPPTTTATPMDPTTPSDPAPTGTPSTTPSDPVPADPPATSSGDTSCPGAGPGGNGKIDCKGAAHLRKVEGLVLTPYPDQRGDTTIGIGHNCVVHGACPDPLADEAAAYALMYSDLVQFETAVCSWDGAKNMNQNQFNAMVSYAFQRGEFGAKDDWSAQIAAGDWAGISQALPTTNPMDRRRDEEKILFDSPSDMNCGC